MTKFKVHELAKELNVNSKDILNQLKKYGIELKSHMSVLDEEQINLVIEIDSQMNDIGDTPLESIKNNVSENNKNESAAKISGREKNAVTEKTDKTEKSDKAEKSDRTDKTEKSDKSEKTFRNEKNDKNEKHVRNDKGRKNDRSDRGEKNPQGENKGEKPANVRANQNNQKKDIRKKENAGEKRPAVNSEEFIVNDNKEKSGKKVRYVDTRQSIVELDKIEGRERAENLIPENIRLDDGRKKNKKKQAKLKENNVTQKKPRSEEHEVKKPEIPKEIKIEENITVGDFAKKLNKSPSEVIMKLMSLGVMANINNTIDFDTAVLIADEFSINVIKEVVLSKEDILFAEEEDKPEDLQPRPPVVVVMGHVDHGKTSLLDAIRHTSVIETEAGGITQHIGAYSVKLGDRRITFLDTPGHEAFTTMRARGAQVTDVAILVVAADDGIMPQTIEAINHAKAANVTIVVAINKIDKDGANPDRVKQMLVEHGLVPEEWGGDTVCVEISAKKRINIDGLLEMVLLVADMQELKANPDKAARGAVIEAEIDKGRGPVATVLVQNGTLKVGDIVIAGTAVGRVRAMVNEKGRRVKTAAPSTPVEILGLSEVPSGGDKFYVVSDEKLARDVAESRRREQKETMFNSAVKVSLDNLFSQIDAGNMKELNVIIKADVQGSVEAVKQSLEKLSNDEVRVRAIHGGVGAINESDVMLANASNAIIVGFNVRPDVGASAAAAQHEVDIRLYRVIYQAIEEIEAAMKGMLDPEFKEVVIGHAEIRQTFKVSGVGTIAGAYVIDGKIMRTGKVRLVRDGIVVYEGSIESLKRFKDDAKEVAENYECGIGFENFNDIKEGDVIECYVMEEIER